MDPSLPAVGAQNQPVDAVALEKLDLVTLIDDPNLPGPQLVR
jgi:hypothetical protein